MEAPAADAGVVGLRLRSGRDACHALVDDLDEDERRWVRFALYSGAAQVRGAPLRRLRSCCALRRFGFPARASQIFSSDTTSLRFADNAAVLRQTFVVELSRRVSNDQIISVDGVNYEVPRGLAGSKIVGFRQVLDGSLRVLDPNQSGNPLQVRRVDLAANARDRRGRPAPDAMGADNAGASLPNTAAGMAFARDFAPIRIEG